MRYFLSFFLILGLFVGVSAVSAEMTSSNYKIRWDTVTSGGGDSTSTSYELRATTGNQGSGESASGNYQTASGFRAGVFDQVITYEVNSQDNTSQVGASAISGTTVTVSDSSGFSVGDFVVVIQDEGGSQASGVGKVISKTASDITLDEIKTAGGTLTLDGSNDYVYLLQNTSADLGTLTSSVVKTVVVGFNVSADVDGGYAIQIMEDGELRDGTNEINEVSDGSVTAGSEEYGIASSDGTLATSTYDTEDARITSNFQEIVTEGSNSFESRNFVTLKAAINSSTLDGNYAHTLTFVVSGNY